MSSHIHTSTLLESGTMVTENKVYLGNEIVFNCEKNLDALALT